VAPDSDSGADRDGIGARRRRRADYLRPTAAAGCGQAWHRSLAFRRGAGDSDGDRAVCTAAWARPLRRLPDRQRADRADGQADPGYLGLLLLCLLVIAFVPGISTALPRAFAIDGA